MDKPSHYLAGSRLLHLAYWLTPSLACIAIYSYGLKTWFFQDDFRWLDLLNGVHSFGDLIRALFTPTVHGTLRPWSERGFFLAFHSLFGLNAWAYRAWVFLTQCGNLMLLASITRRVTGSPSAGFLAAVFWMANSVLVTPMTWTSAYMEILCTFFILLAFWLLLRYIDTERRGYLVAQWVVFLLGFGVMESNLVYPALAASYTCLYARRHFAKTLPMFIPSVVFVALHMIVAPKQTSGLYSLHFDATLLGAFGTYWRYAMVPAQWPELFRVPRDLPAVLLILFTLAIGGFTVRRLLMRDWLPLLFFAWFLILLAPVLPLTQHVSHYYLTLPAIGLAMLSAYGVTRACMAGVPWMMAAVVLAAVYLGISVKVDRAMSRWTYLRSQEMKRAVLGVRNAHRRDPEKAIVLAGVDNGFFWRCLWDQPFRALGIPRVYVAPEDSEHIEPRSSGERIDDRFAATGALRRWVADGRVAVYSVKGGGFRDITSEYTRSAAVLASADEPRHVDAADPLQAYLLGAGWYGVEANFRWTEPRATLKMGGPRAPGEKLRITAACRPVQVAAGPVEVRFAMDGQPLRPARITSCGVFHEEFELPAKTIGKPVVQLELNVRPAFHESENGRELGLVFGTLEIR